MEYQEKTGPLSDYDSLVIPVNHNNQHWISLWVDLKQKTIDVYDSFHERRPAHCLAAASYVDLAHRALAPEDPEGVDFSDWSFNYAIDCPDQRDGWNCGVFMLAFIHCRSLCADLCFTDEDMPLIRRRIAANTLNKSLVM